MIKWQNGKIAKWQSGLEINIVPTRFSGWQILKHNCSSIFKNRILFMNLFLFKKSVSFFFYVLQCFCNLRVERFSVWLRRSLTAKGLSSANLFLFAIFQRKIEETQTLNKFSAFPSTKIFSD